MRALNAALLSWASLVHVSRCQLCRSFWWKTGFDETVQWKSMLSFLALWLLLPLNLVFRQNKVTYFHLFLKTYFSTLRSTVFLEKEGKRSKAWKRNWKNKIIRQSNVQLGLFLYTWFNMKYILAGHRRSLFDVFFAFLQNFPIHSLLWTPDIGISITQLSIWLCAV